MVNKNLSVILDRAADLMLEQKVHPLSPCDSDGRLCAAAMIAYSAIELNSGKSAAESFRFRLVSSSSPQLGKNMIYEECAKYGIKDEELVSSAVLWNDSVYKDAGRGLIDSALSWNDANAQVRVGGNVSAVAEYLRQLSKAA